MSIVAIRTELKSILDVAALVTTVYSEMPTDITETPAISILFNGGEEEPHSTGQTVLTSGFIIRCLVEKTDSSDDDVTQTNLLLALVDSVLAEYRKDDNACLSGAANFMKIAGIGKIEIGSVGTTIVYYIDVLVETKSFNSITL